MTVMEKTAITGARGPAPAGSRPEKNAELAELVDRLSRLSLANEQLRSALAKELEIGLPELSAVAYIENEGYTTPKALANSLSIATGSATALIDRLVSAGLVTREPNPSDRRSVLLTLTARGKQAMGRVRERYAGAIEAALGDDRATVTGVFGGFIERLASQLLEVRPAT